MKNAYPEIKDRGNGGRRKPYVTEKGNGDSPASHDNDFFHLLAENAGDLIFHAKVSPTFHFDYVSPSSTHITGYTPEEFYADPNLAKKCIPPEDLLFRKDPSAWANSNKSKLLEIRWKRKDGTMIWTEHLISITRDKTGKPESFHIIARDITERKQAEAALRESQQFNTSLLENAPHATVVINPDTSVKYVNPAWERINGWTLAEIVGTKAPYPWWPAKFHDVFIEAFKKAIQQGSGKNEVFAQKKNGEIYWIAMNWVSVMNHDGKPAYTIINSVDITDRIQAQEALKESESKYRSIFESANDIIVLMDREGTIVDINNRVKEIGGFEKEEIIGRKFNQLTNIMSKNSIIEASKNFSQTLAGNTTPTYELEMRKKNGELIYFEVNAVPLKINDKTVGDLSILRDITDQKCSILALKESEEKFSKAFSSSPNPVCIFTIKEGVFTEVNESFLRFSGYSKEEVIGHTPAELNLWVNEDEMKRMAKSLKKTGKLDNEEIQSRMKSGEIRTGLFSADTTDIGGTKCMILGITDITEQVKIKDALQESEEKFSKAFQASPSSISISRLNDGKFIEVNDTFLRNKGYTREEVIGHYPKELNLFANKKDDAKLRATLKRQGKVTNREKLCRTKSGHIRTGLISAEIINIGNEPCMIVINTDITQQKLAEEQLRLLSSVTQQVSDATIITDPNFNITYMNQAAEEMFGYTLDEVRGKKLSFFSKKKQSEASKAAMNKVLNAGKVFSATITKKHKDGTTMMCDCRLSPLYDEKGKICSFIDVQRDVTKQNEVEMKLQEHKKLIDSILATTPEGVLVIDSNNRILLANKALHKIFHFNGRTLKNKLLKEIFPTDRFFNLHKAVKRGENEKHSLEFRYQAQELEKIIYCVIVKMDGERTLLTFSDVSREREEEEKLYLTDRLASLGEMAAGLAHELNNPLTGILALSQLLTSSDMPADQKEDIECIHSEAKRAADIVKNVLLFARNKTGENGQSSPNEVMKDVLRLREYEERINNITVVTNLEENLASIPLEKGQLQQVFLNMISNAEAAIKEMNRPGVITVATQRTNNHVNITFSDNGCGIKKQIMPRIFDPFFTTKEIGKGTGLGLSICYSIIVKHGGKISVKSQVNKGTTFTIRMPVVM